MRTLVLNKGHYPIKHITWRQAFRLIFKGRADVISSYEDVVRTPNDFYFIPAVIRLTTFDGLPKAKVTYSKRAILERDNFCCQYCIKDLNYNTMTIDHVLPRSHGGKTTFENTVACCFHCNNKKGNRLNHQAGLTLNQKPKRPNKMSFKLLVGNSIREEWSHYLPRSMLNGVQIIS